MSKLPLPEPTERGEQMHDFPPSLYTAEQMTAHAAAAREQALEEAAKLCETGLRAFLDNSDNHNEFAWCAAAIRELKDKP